VPRSNEWSYTSTPAWHGAQLQYRDNFTFTSFEHPQSITFP